MKDIIDNRIVLTKEPQATITPEMAIHLLKEGNKRFVEKRPFDRDHEQHVIQTSEDQFPFAVVLGCIDSRVPAELIFDQGIGDIFNVRIAGNFVNPDILGSIEFGCKVKASKAVVVLGHSGCGAIKGACDDVRLGHLTTMLQNLKPAVDAVTNVEGDRSSANPVFVQQVMETNVHLTIENIRKQSPLLKELEELGEITIVGAWYDVSSGEVHFEES